jgi:hypothetical protein
VADPVATVLVLLVLGPIDGLKLTRPTALKVMVVSPGKGLATYNRAEIVYSPDELSGDKIPKKEAYTAVMVPLRGMGNAMIPLLILMGLVTPSVSNVIIEDEPKPKAIPWLG